ncbi:MAG: ImmA/IrrE family metallo-endopeptidase [Polaromonas sp.]|nr:ImmA/IrrE family metallo-endopeptidase [Polaromonas sp.]
MNSIRVGDSLEEKIHALFISEIENDRFWAKKACCKVFRKKGYYSKDRGTKIVFDLSVEIYLPGVDEFSVVMLVECKNYNHPVPVDDAEEFFSKAQQISGANIKCVIASTNSFQSGTRAFSKSKGIGLLRYFDKTTFKWELRRSPSGGARSASAEASAMAEEGLIQEDFLSNLFDLYCQSAARTTNSLWDFIEDFVLETSLTRAEIKKIENPRSRLASQVDFLEKDDLENRATSMLLDIGYSDNEVSLEDLCAREQTKCGLRVLKNLEAIGEAPANAILGRIIFDPLEIHLFRQPPTTTVGRDRFTLAHELAHHLLDHGRYMAREFCDESDLSQKPGPGIVGTDIARLEFQANYLAGCILLPRANLIEDFRQLLRTLDISNKGYGALFVDKQPCNLQSYQQVTTPLMQKYAVSRTAITIRLESLGLLIDARLNTFQAIQTVLSSWGAGDSVNY